MDRPILSCNPAGERVAGYVLAAADKGLVPELTEDAHRRGARRRWELVLGG